MRSIYASGRHCLAHTSIPLTKLSSRDNNKNVNGSVHLKLQDEEVYSSVIWGTIYHWLSAWRLVQHENRYSNVTWVAIYDCGEYHD